MRKAAILTAVFAAVGIAIMTATLWSSVNRREEASVPGAIRATKIAELRDPLSFSQYPDPGRSGPESASSPTRPPTLGER